MTRTPDQSADAAPDKGLCEINLFDPERVAAARAQMLPKLHVDRLAGVFQCLGQPTRVRILHALFAGELCVCDLAQILQLSVSAISHQLRLLRSQQLVKFRKDGKMAYYSIDDEHVKSLFSCGLDHIRHE